MKMVLKKYINWVLPEERYSDRGKPNQNRHNKEVVQHLQSSEHFEKSETMKANLNCSSFPIDSNSNRGPIDQRNSRKRDSRNWQRLQSNANIFQCQNVPLPLERNEMVSVRTLLKEKLLENHTKSTSKMLQAIKTMLQIRMIKMQML